IAFAVSSQVDSRTILDAAGAEKLLGKGDMLYAPSGGGKPVRVQGCFISDEEVARVVGFVKDQHETIYNEKIIEHINQETDEEKHVEEDANECDYDALLQQAVEIAVEAGQASISMLQRRLRVGYARAGRLIDEMARRNIVGQAEGAKPRQVLLSHEDYHKMFPVALAENVYKKG
ncbi:MAG: DNA translocase FtsK, partial [Clostridia bacterium]